MRPSVCALGNFTGTRAGHCKKHTIPTATRNNVLSLYLRDNEMTIRPRYARREGLHDVVKSTRSATISTELSRYLASHVPTLDCQIRQHGTNTTTWLKRSPGNQSGALEMPCL